MKTFGPIKAVIFDMDGLLLDTEGIYTEVTSLIAERYGRTFDWSVKQNIIGRGANEAEFGIERIVEVAVITHEKTSGYSSMIAAAQAPVKSIEVMPARRSIFLLPRVQGRVSLIR